MVNLNRRVTILMHIQKYCNEISKTFDFFGIDFDIFKENNIPKLNLFIQKELKN